MIQQNDTELNLAVERLGNNSIFLAVRKFIANEATRHVNDVLSPGRSEASRDYQAGYAAALRDLYEALEPKATK